MSTTPPVLASWIRECDDHYFAPWLARRPGIEVRNARLLEAANDPRARDFAALDGLLLTGGPDIDAPFLRHQVVPPDAPLDDDTEPARDAWEFAAVASALERGLPIFAICKGHQLLNVALGGTLLLDIPGHNDPADRDRDAQPLRYQKDAVPDSRRFARVNSSHHQAIDRPGNGLEIEAWREGDDVIEQVRLRGYPTGCVGVQYHPERGQQYAPLFDDFLDRVAARAGAHVNA